MTSAWDRLLAEEEHVLREPDIFVVGLARTLRELGARRVLDWGCGAGRHVVYLAREGFEVTGLDPAPTAIRRAHEWVQRERLQAVLSTAEPGRIPAEEGAFDAVISLFAIEHGTREEVARGVAEILRVLRPGGHCLVTLSSADDALAVLGQRAPGGARVPRAGAEAGVPHYLTRREDIVAFFASARLLEVTHVRRRLDERVSAHWSIIATKP